MRAWKCIVGRENRSDWRIFFTASSDGIVLTSAVSEKGEKRPRRRGKKRWRSCRTRISRRRWRIRIRWRPDTYFRGMGIFTGFWIASSWKWAAFLIGFSTDRFPSRWRFSGQRGCGCSDVVLIQIELPTVGCCMSLKVAIASKDFSGKW